MTKAHNLRAGGDGRPWSFSQRDTLFLLTPRSEAICSGERSAERRARRRRSPNVIDGITGVWLLMKPY